MTNIIAFENCNFGHWHNGVKPIFLAAFVVGVCGTARSQDIAQIGQAPVAQFNGTLQARFGLYHAQGIDPRHTPGFWSISGSPVLSVLGIQLPFMLVLSDQQRSFQQPFNQFGLSPRYKWAKLHLGYRDLTFSKFTLAGHRALMAGVELNPGKFRFGFMYGRLQKAVAEDTAAVYDPSKFISDIPIPAYGRTGYAVKLGVGTEEQYVDVVVLRARDDARSIPVPEAVQLAPAENLAVGLAGRVKLSEVLRWEFDAAGSAYTRDLRAAPLAEEDRPWARVANPVFTTRTSTQGLMAVETGLVLKWKRLRGKLTYRRVDPDYKSMGTYYFQTDVEQVTGTASGNLLKNRLSANATVGWQHNNLKRLRAATAKRIMANLGLSYTGGKAFGCVLNYSNFGIVQDPLRPVANDTARFRQVSQNLLLQPRVTYSASNGSHFATCTINFFALSDRGAEAFSRAMLTGLHTDLAYTRNWKQDQARLGGGAIFRNTESVVGRTISKGFHVEAGRSWLKEGRLGTELRGSFLANALPAGGHGSTWQLDLQGSMQATKRISFVLTLSHQDNRSNDPSVPAFTEDTGVIGADIRF